MKVVIKGEAITAFDPESDRCVSVPAGQYKVSETKPPSGSGKWLVITDPGPYKGFGMSKASWESSGATFSNGIFGR